MPVAVALGGDPVLTYAATAPLPYGFDELVLAGLHARHRPGVHVVLGPGQELLDRVHLGQELFDRALCFRLGHVFSFVLSV